MCVCARSTKTKQEMIEYQPAHEFTALLHVSRALRKESEH